jgi:uncharacterized protein YjiS (DUF1127 family)
MSSTCTGVGQQRHSRPASMAALTTVIRNIRSTVKTWRARGRSRRELAARSERELRDMGTCWASIADEVGKPFWRA